ncbi:hypothetical protein VTK73DRAFT_9271 [Phialemonium thermophilum]|uniref:Uncharacterized protein n=1 Tax=Phialemonium thermophilum TaxID=223376 RepID=A0ABR3W3C8_9PEZI
MATSPLSQTRFLSFSDTWSSNYPTAVVRMSRFLHELGPIAGSNPSPSASYNCKLCLVIAGLSHPIHSKQFLAIPPNRDQSVAMGPRLAPRSTWLSLCPLHFLVHLQDGVCRQDASRRGISRHMSRPSSLPLLGLGGCLHDLSHTLHVGQV